MPFPDMSTACSVVNMAAACRKATHGCREGICLDMLHPRLGLLKKGMSLGRLFLPQKLC
jgi:hypothetical protein